MHQGHNIPWRIISSNFRFTIDNKRCTPPRTGIIAKENPNMQKELKHFINKFVQTIRAFSETAKKKYTASFSSPSEGNLFSDELRLKYPKFLNEKNQRIEYWIKRGASGGDLADVVKILLNKNEISTLLMLAHHPPIPIGNLDDAGYTPDDRFGFSQVRELALASYIFYNSAEAIGILETGEYADKDREYAYLMENICFAMSFPAQQIPHIQFLEDCGTRGSWNRGHIPDAVKALYGQCYPRLQQYLKDLFALMYHCDIILRECGLDPRWEEEIAHKYPLSRHGKLVWDVSQSKFVGYRTIV